MEIHYRTDVQSDFPCETLPEVAVFCIPEATARKIVDLAALVKSKGLYKLELFDYRAEYFAHDPIANPALAAELGDENEVRTEMDCLNVTATEFWFSAEIKHTNVLIRGERQPVSRLAEALKLVEEPSTASRAEKEHKFVTDMAALLIWGYDKPDGEPYKECPEPSDGFLDSHCCLMSLIEDARALQKSE